MGDVLVGPWVPHPRGAGSKRARLFLLVDDHSRPLLHGRWVFEENARWAQSVLRAAIARRGLPDALYMDNGAPFAAAALERTCAVLGIRLVHSKPYSPQGRGKQERLNRVIRERFLLEAEAAGISDLEELTLMVPISCTFTAGGVDEPASAKGWPLVVQDHQTRGRSDTSRDRAAVRGAVTAVALGAHTMGCGPSPVGTPCPSRTAGGPTSVTIAQASANVVEVTACPLHPTSEDPCYAGAGWTSP